MLLSGHRIILFKPFGLQAKLMLLLLLLLLLPVPGLPLVFGLAFDPRWPTTILRPFKEMFPVSGPWGGAGGTGGR